MFAPEWYLRQFFRLTILRIVGAFRLNARHCDGARFKATHRVAPTEFDLIEDGTQ